jgi:hypothetical protein
LAAELIQIDRHYPKLRDAMAPTLKKRARRPQSAAKNRSPIVSILI